MVSKVQIHINVSDVYILLYYSNLIRIWICVSREQQETLACKVKEVWAKGSYRKSHSKVQGSNPIHVIISAMVSPPQSSGKVGLHPYNREFRGIIQLCCTIHLYWGKKSTLTRAGIWFQAKVSTENCRPLTKCAKAL